MYVTDNGQISNFPPGVTEVPCRICGQMVDVTDESPEWDEKFPPAHRLCANSQMGASFFAPLWVVELVDIWRALQRQEKKLSREKWKEIVDALRESATYVSTLRDNDARSVVRKRMYAARVLAAVFQMAHGAPPPKGKLILSAPHTPHVKAAQHREYERRTGKRPQWRRKSRKLASHGR